MYRFVSGQPENLTIQIKTCTDRGGHNYSHPFIGCFALSRAMIGALHEMNIRIKEGSKVPEEFFDKYLLMECEYHPENPEDEPYVTSDYWYTCREKWQDVVISI